MFLDDYIFINIFLQYFLIEFVNKICLSIKCAMCFMAMT